MPVKRAVTAFQQERKSCAESILLAFREYRSLTDDEIRTVSAGGHGRAEGGLCGALSAALHLAETPETRDRVRKRFIAQAGSDKCREIRRARTVPCLDCVHIAATLTAEHVVAIAATEQRTEP